MEQFSVLTQVKLGYYAYCLVDHAEGKAFYVGKGKGNRVFQHAVHAELDKDAVSEKLDKFVRLMLVRMATITCNIILCDTVLKSGMHLKSSLY